MKGAVELQGLLAAADPISAGLGICKYLFPLNPSQKFRAPNEFEGNSFAPDERPRRWWIADCTAGLKAAVGHYFGYGSPVARSPLPSNGADKLKAMGEIQVFDELMKLEQSL